MCKETETCCPHTGERAETKKQNQRGKKGFKTATINYMQRTKATTVQRVKKKA